VQQLQVYTQMIIDNNLYTYSQTCIKRSPLGQR